MSGEEKRAIEYLKRHILPYYGSKGRIEFMLNDIILNLIDNQQKEIAQKDNIIDAMAEQLTTPVHNKQWVIDYFEGKIK